MGTNIKPAAMYSEGMTKPQILCFVITFTLADLQSDQYRRLGFQNKSYLPRVADALSGAYQARGSVAILTTKARKAGAKGDNLPWGGQSVCDGTASLARARHH